MTPLSLSLPSPPPSEDESAEREADGGSRLSRPYPLPPAARASSVLAQDLKTPDHHVQRDARLIRLTGVHPFNTEPPLTALFDEGFVTTRNLHFVRNHGHVPQVLDEDALGWPLSVEGMVRQPLTLTLRQLLADFEQHTYPVTLVCAGNRRKEQNMVRKTNGFSWGAAGLSTALWTGIPLRHLLERARPLRGARFVCFEGADQLPNGGYGTSVKLAWARSSERGILLAHRMNGEPLPPDHGHPLRVIVPGQIGGRSVKWLRKIVVTAEPSRSWYHMYDNRVLPTSISPAASADRPDLWQDERYAIYDLNANSAICFPEHGERLPVSEPGHVGTRQTRTYKVRGYAYAGGGKRVTRVELSLDDGQAWRLADVEYPEDRYRLASEGEQLYGGRIDVVAEREACFCWCFWSLAVPLADLQAAGSIVVRCMDDSMMVQPRDMYWSVLGMMNNPWFRVVIHTEQDGRILRFEHPAPPRPSEQGWMERVRREGGNLASGFWGGGMAQTGTDTGGAEEEEGEPRARISMVDAAKEDRVVTVEELHAHASDRNPWFVVQGHVYDGAPFLEDHPGGAPSITAAAALDVTEEFLAIHSEKAQRMMADYHVGVLDKSALPLGGPSSGPYERADGKRRQVFLGPQRPWATAILASKKAASPDSQIFSFRLEHAQQRLGVPAGQHLLVRLRDPVTREAIVRPYTPQTGPLASPGTLDLLLKIYPAGAGGRPGGRMTPALNSLPIGHAVEFKGPMGPLECLAGGQFKIGFGSEARVRWARRLVMVCGGSGIAAVLPVLRAVLAEPAAGTAEGAGGTTQCLLLDGNRTQEDILCRAELDDLAAEHADRLRVVHILSQETRPWKGHRGWMDAAFLACQVGPPSATASDDDGGELALVCGPRAMERGVRQSLVSMGWSRDNMHFF